MFEFGMFICLLGAMGLYIMKSADLPQELKDRSKNFKTENSESQKTTFKVAIPNIQPKIVTKATNSIIQKEVEISLLNKKIDKLTLEITSLELEIKVNNEKNLEIQKVIDERLTELAKLQQKLDLLKMA